MNKAIVHALGKVSEVTLGFWIIKIAATTLGETGGDAVTMSMNLGYLGGSTILFVLLIATLALWQRSVRSVSVNTINSRKAEAFYWATIMFSQTLGTALGDWMTDSEGGLGLGYPGGALIFAAGLAVIAAAHFWTKVSHTLLFWAAFILGCILSLPQKAEQLRAPR